MNDKDAVLILREDRYAKGANWPTDHSEYVCPCGRGKIVEDRVHGFDDHAVYFECDDCKSKYDIILGCGHRWETREKQR
ncbi:MAG: hypothetical protein J1F33_07080 [Clostridiales bacterium]|nr:hypothetical protein [Clostridiales bacterium]